MALTKFNYNSFDVTPVASTAMAFNSGANGLTTMSSSAMVLIKTVTASSSGTVTFVNGDLPPHNMVIEGFPELSHPDLAFVGGESFNVTFTRAGDYEFQCEPHAGAGMKGVIHVE